MTGDDNTDGYGPDTFYVYNGLSVEGDDVLGEYTASVVFGYAQADTRWILTARIKGEVKWVEEGHFGASYSAEYLLGSRRLDTATTSSTPSQSDAFAVALESYDGVDC